MTKAEQEAQDYRAALEKIRFEIQNRPGLEYVKVILHHALHPNLVNRA